MFPLLADKKIKFSGVTEIIQSVRGKNGSSNTCRALIY